MVWGEADSAESAVVHLVRLVGNCSGYRYYRTGWVPHSKDPAALQQRLNAKYRFDFNEDEKHRRRKAGLANVTMVRVGHWFIMLATEPYGSHYLGNEHNSKLKDFFYNETKKGLPLSKVKDPIRIGDYLLKRTAKGSTKERVVHVRLAKKVHDGLMAQFTHRALEWPKRRLEEAFAELDFLWYEPVKGQVIEVFDAVNRIRTKELKRCGLDTRCLRFGVVPALPLKAATKGVRSARGEGRSSQPPIEGAFASPLGPSSDFQSAR